VKKLIIILFILVTCALLFSAEPIAYLIKSKGSVQIYRDHKPIKFKNGELLYNNDEIITADKAYAAIKYVDGAATVKIFPNSVIDLTAVKQEKQLNKSSYDQVGSLYSKISNKIKGMYKTETPNTVASVKGTGFVTRYNADKKTYIIVTEGEVLVQNKNSGKTVTVSQGFTAVSDDDGEITIGETAEGEISEEEMTEIESVNLESQKTMRFQITDENGNIKYIDITY
jgi:hypothetical protein